MMKDYKKQDSTIFVENIHYNIRADSIYKLITSFYTKDALIITQNIKAI